MEDKYVIYKYFTQNGKINHSIDEISLTEWDTLQEKHPLWAQLSGNIGIGSDARLYFQLNDKQNIKVENFKVVNLIDKYIYHYAKKNNLNPKDINYEFINYGRTQLVYVMTDGNGKKHTLLVKQPAVEFGAVKQEHDILCELKEKDDHVIAPIDYFALGDQELYVTPYLEQARCIASDRDWGVYIPEPVYRFEEFSRKESDIINACMIAKLISYYNEETQEGLSSCKLGGGDFILAKGYEKQQPTIDWIMQNLFLIAGREKIHCSLDEYIDIIKNEFSRRTIDDQIVPKINVRGRVPMTEYQMQNGILLGKELLKLKGLNQDTNFTL